MSDYAHKTVTLDPHPHISTPHASVHPCRHGEAMLRIIKTLLESNKTPIVDQYLFIFLKFIQSVIPTIEYDFTFDVDVQGKS
jgi:ubiquitin-like-conjugating enzyme ATG3